MLATGARSYVRISRPTRLALNLEIYSKQRLIAEQTAEGTRLQLVSAQGSTSAIVVSTLMEAWEVVRSGLVSEGIVKDVGSSFA